MKNLQFISLSFLLVCFAVGTASDGAEFDFDIREELGRQWNHECVTFPLTEEQLNKTKKKRKLLDDGGDSVPWQVFSDGEGKPRIAFHVDLAPYATVTFRFGEVRTEPGTVTDLQVETSDDVLRISNSLTGIALARTQPGSGEGPIRGVRLNSDRWVGTSRITGKLPIRDWQTEVIHSGPVFVEAVCRIGFGDQGSWESRYRIYAGEPVVLVDETFAVESDSSMRLILNDRFNATEIFYRQGRGAVGQNATWTVKSGNVFVMEPWLRWWMADRQGSTFSLFNRQDSDMLSLAAREAGAWIDPAIPQDKQPSPLVNVISDGVSLHADFPLAVGGRKWMLGAFNRDESLAVLDDQERQRHSPVPYRYLVKHGHFPLDRFKDYVLRWQSKLTYPRLLIKPDDIQQFRNRIEDPAPFRKTVNHYTNSPHLLNHYAMDAAIPAYIATGDAALGKLLANAALDMLQYSVNELVNQNGMPYGAAPHQQARLATGVGVADVVMGSSHITAKQRDRIRALVAFLGYTTSRPEYWSTVRGFAANPNMTTSVYGYRTRLAALISDHPSAEQWVDEGLAELRSQLNTWSDEKGGWREAPHYAMVSYDEILGMLAMASNAGFNDWLYSEPKVKDVIRWIAKIATPPDSRIGGYRHHPPIGNTYVNEPNGEYGILAYLFRERDPAFSAEMQWMYQQSNEYGSPGIGGFFPAFAGYRKILTDTNLPAKVPRYTSELFPESGVVLRDHYASGRETYLHMIHGQNHEHYDFDSGSIILYGKGRILADEFGYSGRSPRDQHSMVDAPQASGEIMTISEFETTDRFDYIASKKSGWQRQIVFVKGQSPDTPSYFVINDSLDEPGPGTWRIWLTAAEVRINGHTALVVGKEDVDMDVFFLSPSTPKLSSQEKSIKSGAGLKPNWSWGAMTTTQIGLVSSLESTTRWSVVLIPRLKTEKQATIETFANGRAVKVTHSAGTDYVFLSETPFKFQNDQVEFEGRAGMAQLRGRDISVELGTEGILRAGAKSVSRARPVAIER